MSALTDRRDALNIELAAVRAKRLEILTAGQSFSVSGGISVNQPLLKELSAEEGRIIRQLMILDGGEPRTAPDFSGNDGGTV